jgi:hypothetical protein
VLVRACESDPGRRYESARSMHADLKLLERGASIKRKRAAEQRWAAAKKLAIAAAATALLVPALLWVKGFQQGYTPNLEAVRQYELGRWYYNHFTTEAHKKAVELLNQAIKTDPQYVRPYRSRMRPFCRSNITFLSFGCRILVRDKGQALAAIGFSHDRSSGRWTE